MPEEKSPRTCNCGETATEEELLARLDEVIAEYRAKPGALIPVLQIAQSIFGYLPDVAIRRISLGLNKSYSEVAGVVGFYSFFSTVPRGKNVIRVCLGTACYVRGGKSIAENIVKEYKVGEGETTPDRRFTYETVRCLGACGLAPVIVVDENVHGRVKTQKLKSVLDEYQ